MTRLLVSVRTVSEARVALAAGADLIDLKEPKRGALGPVDSQIAADVVEAIGGTAPLSMALGELRGLDESVLADDGPAPQVPPSVNFAKLGLAGCAEDAGWRERWLRWRAGLPSSVAPVAVVYADWRQAGAPSPGEVLEMAAAAQCSAVLIDTHGKSQGNLFEHFPLAELRRFQADVRKYCMLSVLAGSLSYDVLPQALALEPDFVAVRGAVCQGGRDGAVVKELVRRWADELQARQRPNAQSAPFA